MIFFIASSLPLSISWCWWLWHLFHLDFKTIWFIFLVQHIPSLSQKIRQYVTKCTFYSVINLTEFLFVTKGAVDIHQLLLLHHEDLALEYSPTKLCLWNSPKISVPQRLISWLRSYLPQVWPSAFSLLRIYLGKILDYNSYRFFSLAKQETIFYFSFFTFLSWYLLIRN